jgi:hypothetical protein
MVRVFYFIFLSLLGWVKGGEWRFIVGSNAIETIEEFKKARMSKGSGSNRHANVT